MTSNTRHKSSVVLILSDVINHFEFPVRPGADDYFVLKPMHSAFFQTPLEILLRYLGATNLILCGLATNSCIICTAHDANMSEFRLFVPSDCSAARSPREHRQAIEHIKEMAGARIMPAAKLRLDELKEAPH